MAAKQTSESMVGEPLRNERIDSRLSVPSLIIPWLQRFRIETFSELLAINFDQTDQFQGVGEKKRRLLKGLIAQARELAGGAAEPPGKVITSLACADVPLAVSQRPLELTTPLVFIPSLVREELKRRGVKLIRDMLAISEDAWQKHTRWFGEKKTREVVAVRRLYIRLMAAEEIPLNMKVRDLIEANVLCHVDFHETTIGDFIRIGLGCGHKGKLKGDVDGLRSLLSLRLIGNERSTRVPEGFPGEFGNLNWRDVPLDLPPRVVKVLDHLEIATLFQLFQLSTNPTKVGATPTGARSSGLKNHLGKKAIRRIRLEFDRMRLFGLRAYREHVTYPEPAPDLLEQRWNDIPLRMTRKLSRFLKKQRFMTIRDLHQFAIRGQVVHQESGKAISAFEYQGFKLEMLSQLRSELRIYLKQGLNGYRFGGATKPSDVNQLTNTMLQVLRPRAQTVVISRLEGCTLETIATSQGVTRERVRQLVKAAIRKLKQFHGYSEEFFVSVKTALADSIFVDSRRAMLLLGTDDLWRLLLVARVAECPCYSNRAQSVSRFPPILQRALRNKTFSFLQQSNLENLDARISIESLFAHTDLARRRRNPLPQFSQETLSLRDLCAVFDRDRLRSLIRSQLYSAKRNGIYFDQLKVISLASSPEELKNILGDDCELLRDGRLRIAKPTYSIIDRMIEFVRNSIVPVSPKLLLEAFPQIRFVTAIIGRVLRPSYELIAIERGRYVHVDRLGMSVRDVMEVAAWGASRLALTRGCIDGEELLRQYQASGLAHPVTNVFQIVSIVAKHRDVRRPSNALILEYRDAHHRPTKKPSGRRRRKPL